MATCPSLAAERYLAELDRLSEEYEEQDRAELFRLIHQWCEEAGTEWTREVVDAAFREFKPSGMED